MRLKYLFFFIFLFLPTIPVYAGVPESYEWFRTHKINHYFTLEKAFELQRSNPHKLLKLSEETVFWKGKILYMKRYPNWTVIKLAVGSRRIECIAESGVRNLEFDRTGYLVGVKGHLQVSSDGTIQFLQLNSILLFNSKRLKASITRDPAQLIQAWIQMYNPQYTDSARIAGWILSEAEKNRLDPLLVLAFFTVESALDKNALSHSGAVGFGQLMPSTAAWLGVDPYDMEQNISASCRYIAYLLRIWQGEPQQLSYAIASYNAGPTAIKRAGGTPKYSETVNYLFFVKSIYKNLLNIAGRGSKYKL